MSAQENATVVRRFVEEVIAKGDIESAARFVWEDVVEQVPFPDQGPGLKGLNDILRAMRSAFPDLNFAIKEQIAESDKVARCVPTSRTYSQRSLAFVSSTVCHWMFYRTVRVAPPGYRHAV